MTTSPDLPSISEFIWDSKYRFKQFDGTPIDLTPADTWKRVASALAEAESEKERADRAEEFYRVMVSGEFSPAGRIIAGAGTGRNVTLSNCFTMGTIPDSMDGIFSHLREAALTMQQGGGIGYDFSTIRPKGAEVKGVAADASGPLTFMDVWDAMCRTVMSAGSRRGAMMATMRCDHPDIEAFIDAKRDPAKLRMFNLSVLVTDEFMEAVKSDHNWRLHFENHRGETLVEKIVPARALWDKIMQSTYAYAEPGVIFIDRVNEDHNLGYLEKIATTNPCGEKPMGPYASCLLGSVNLAKLVLHAFTKDAKIDHERLKKTVKTAIRMMDNVIEVGQFPLESQLEKARADRQLGLGVTGLADALIMCGLTYGSPQAVAWTEDVMRLIALAAYTASCDLAEERGPFPTFNADEFLKPTRFAGRMLPSQLKRRIKQVGIRNGLLLSIAPTGTISLFAGNVSSGIEPVFALSYDRKVLQPDGSHVIQTVEDYAVAAYRRFAEQVPGLMPTPASLPPEFVTAQTLSPEAHVVMQAAAQKWVDSSISKTINCPEDISFEEFKSVYERAYELGCKGCTTYRPNDVTGSVLSVKEEPKPEPEPEVQSYIRVLDESGRTIVDSLALSVDFEGAPGADTYTAILPGTKMVMDAEEPQQRPEKLEASAYKIKMGSDPAFYVTISDIVSDGQRRPFEVFFNTANPEHIAWSTALARMISAIFRRPHDSSFVVEELKSIFDPKGGGFWKGSYRPSMVAAIGQVVQQHMEAIGYGKFAPTTEKPRKVEQSPVLAMPYGDSSDRAQIAALGRVPELHPGGKNFNSMGASCPSCRSFNLQYIGGCATCLDCGHSKCG